MHEPCVLGKGISLAEAYYDITYSCRVYGTSQGYISFQLMVHIWCLVSWGILREAPQKHLNILGEMWRRYDESIHCIFILCYIREMSVALELFDFLFQALVHK